MTAEEPGERAGTKPAEDLEECLPETLQGRRSRGTKGGSTIRLLAKAGLPTVERTDGADAGDRDWHERVGNAPVAGMKWRLDHVRQSGAQIAGEQPANDLKHHVFRALLAGLGESEAPSCEGADRAVGSTV